MMNVYYFHHQADELLGTASEQFLGKSVKEIKQTILQTLEGHLRAILGKYIRMDGVRDAFNYPRNASP
jgi:flotillin